MSRLSEVIWRGESAQNSIDTCLYELIECIDNGEYEKARNRAIRTFEHAERSRSAFSILKNLFYRVLGILQHLGFIMEHEVPEVPINDDTLVESLKKLKDRIDDIPY